MEFNGQPTNDVLAKKMQEMMDNITPEMEAEFEKKEQERLEQEAQARVNSSNDYSNLPKRFWACRFDDFEYTKETAKAKSLCINKNSDSVLLLFGSTGRGKTTILASAIHERAWNGFDSSRYFNIRDLELKLRKCRNFNTDEDEETFIRHLSNFAFLCIDEVGTCPNRKEESDFLCEVIGARFDNCLPTWIATNLAPVDFKALISNEDISGKTKEELVAWAEKKDMEHPILNRIKSVAVPLVLTGESYRSATNGSNV